MRGVGVMLAAVLLAGCTGVASPGPTVTPAAAPTATTGPSATPFRTPPPLGSFDQLAMERLFGTKFLVDRLGGDLQYTARFTNVWFTFDVADTDAITSTAMIIFDVRVAPTTADGAGQKAWAAWLNNWASDAAQWVLAQLTKYIAAPGPKVSVQETFAATKGAFLMDFPTSSKGPIPAVASTAYVSISVAK